MVLDKKWLFTSIVASLFVTFFSCKKVVDKIPDDSRPNPTPVAPLDTAGSTLMERYYDSVFLYAKQIYCWNEQLPSYSSFLPRQYKTNDTITGLDREIFAITRYAINPATKKSYEQSLEFNSQTGKWEDYNANAKYSYIMKTRDAYNGGVSGNIVFNNDYAKKLKMTLDGKENGLGFIIAFIGAKLTKGTADSIVPLSNPDSTLMLVRYVTTGSPAYHKGIKRGDIIAKINNRALTYENNLNEIFDALEANDITLTIFKPSTNTYKTVSINKELYTFNPVFKDTVVAIEGKKIGYIAYKSFTEYDKNSKQPLLKAFQRFASEGIQDLVIDLRYNGGGYVNTAANFIGMVAPASADGKVGFTNHYNTMMQQGKATILKNQPQRDDNDHPIPGKTFFDYDWGVASNTDYITKIGAVNALPKVYFIVSSHTASSSELLINSLKPYMETVLIGTVFNDDGKRTYGKPVGFFEVRIGAYSMWISNFVTKNAQGVGDYFAGMPTNYQAFDDIRYNFGDPRERAFREAIRKILGNEQYTPPITMSKRAGIVRSAYPEAPPQVFRGVGSVGEVTPIHDMVVKPKRQ